MANIAEAICILEFLIHALRALDAAEIKAFFRLRWFETWSRHHLCAADRKVQLVLRARTAVQHLEPDPRAEPPNKWSWRPSGYSHQQGTAAMGSAAARLEASVLNAKNAEEEAAIISARAEAAYARVTVQKPLDKKAAKCFGSKFGRVESLPRIPLADCRQGATL